MRDPPNQGPCDPHAEAFLDFSAHPKDSRRHLTGFGLVVLLHLGFAWALANGLAQRLVEVIRSPLDTRIIDDLKQPPPPPDKLPPPPLKTLPPPPFSPPPEVDRKSTRLNSSHVSESRMPSSA